MPSHEVKRVAVIEDDRLMGESLVQSLALEGLGVEWWQSGREALDGLSEAAHLDAIVCDIRLPDMSGEELFDALNAANDWRPVLFMTAFADVDQAVRLMRAGAADYVTKPFAMDEFLDRLAALMPSEPEAAEGVLGVSARMRDIEVLLHRIADHGAPVLISGETGVGKEVVARHLHAVSQSPAPFVAVNCAAIPGDLLESEIFGHEKGAFTGAHSRHIGYAERAGNGILFLDEIGDMPLHLQSKILRLVEERSFRRLGAEKEIPFKARIVAATNVAIEDAMSEGRFREDLFYRLNTFSIEIPPLRERREDIAWLCDRLFAAAASEPDCRIRGISAGAYEVARHHDWPGNAREVRNRMERAAVLAPGEWILPSDLFPKRHPGEHAETSSLSHVRDAAERRAIEGALRDAKGQIQEAARMLGISRTTLWEKMKRLDVARSVPGSTSPIFGPGKSGRA